jgi:hypothetical protein
VAGHDGRLMTVALPFAEPEPPVDQVSRFRVSPLNLRSIPENLDIILPTQWPLGSRHGSHRRVGWPALAAAVLADACRCAGLLPMRQPVGPGVRQTALAYLFGPPGSEALPLELVCALLDYDVARLRQCLRQRLTERFQACLEA